MELQHYKAEDLILNDSFVRYCLRSNDTDVQFWENWLIRYPHKLAEVEKARQWVFMLGLRLTPAEKEVAFQDLRNRIQDTTRLQDEVDSTVPLAPVRSRWKIILRISAAVILLLLAATWLRKITEKVGGNITTTGYALFESGDSIRKIIELKDGSRIVLNTHSKLKVPTDYNVTQRQLFLEGEAYFEVAGTAAKPFVVMVNQLEVKALGTVFKVRAYAFDSLTAVALVNGKVRVADTSMQRETVDLAPGELLTSTHQKGYFNRTTFDINRELNWRSGKLIFKDASLTEIATTLEYWYGIKVQLAPGKHKAIHFNGIFVNQPIDEVMAAICFVNGLHVREQDQIFYFHTNP